LECDSWQLASVEGKNGNEFVFQGHQLLAKLCVETVKKPDEATERLTAFVEVSGNYNFA
jgi:hypothetical protein